MATRDLGKATVDEALASFSRAEGPDLIESSGILISANALVAYARDPRMMSGLDRLAAEIERRASADSLRYLARLWHMTAQAPLNRLRSDFAKRLRPLPIPSTDFSELRDPNDRRYAAEALADVGGEWLAEYAARSLVYEEAGERARASLATALFARTDDLNASVRLVSIAMTDLEIISQDRGASRARRLIRILEALSAAVVEIDPPVNDGIGAEIEALLDASLRHDSIGELEVSEELATASLAFIRMIVRFHGTLAAEADTFASVARLRRLFHSTEWPDRVVPEARALARTVREALIFLAKQGIADERLHRVHRELVGDVAASVLIKQALGQGHGIPGHLSTWLVSGRKPRTITTQAALESSILEAIDGDLARAFRDSAEIESQLSSSGEELIDAAHDVSRALGEQVEALLRRVRRIARLINSAAEKRGFRLRGNSGEVVEFSASEHETADGRPASKTVRLRTRIVERARGESSIDVVLKAEVDRLES